MKVLFLVLALAYPLVSFVIAGCLAWNGKKFDIKTETEIKIVGPEAE